MKCQNVNNQVEPQDMGIGFAAKFWLFFFLIFDVIFMIC